MTFYLSSHDYISSPEPRLCELIKFLRGAAGANFILVKITPPLPKALLKVGGDIDRLGLLIIEPNRTMADIGKKIVSVDIFFVPSPFEDVLDEGQIVRIGTGGLHATFDDAQSASPLDTE
jgi:hypothetical protein